MAFVRATIIESATELVRATLPCWYFPDYRDHQSDASFADAQCDWSLEQQDEVSVNETSYVVRRLLKAPLRDPRVRGHRFVA